MENLSKLSLPKIYPLWQTYIKTPIPKLGKSTLIKHIFWYQQACQNILLEKALEKTEAGSALHRKEILYEVGTKFVRSYKGAL